MKSLITLLAFASTSVFAGNVTFNYKTQNVSPSVKNYIVKTLNEKCSEAFDDQENVVIVSEITIDRVDQGMELEYVATIKVIEDYAHSPAKTITLEFDEERYHGESFSFFKLESSADYLCR